MQLQINNVMINKNRTYIEARGTENDNVKLEMIFKGPNGLAYEVVEINVSHSKQSIIKLEQTGSYHSRVKEANKAFDMLYDRIELLTDEEEIQKIKRAARFC